MQSFALLPTSLGSWIIDKSHTQKNRGQVSQDGRFHAFAGWRCLWLGFSNGATFRCYEIFLEILLNCLYPRWWSKQGSEGARRTSRLTQLGRRPWSSAGNTVWPARAATCEDTQTRLSVTLHTHINAAHSIPAPTKFYSVLYFHVSISVGNFFELNNFSRK